MMAAMSPREHVAALIEELAQKGSPGEDILLMIERQILGYSEDDRRLAFFWLSEMDDEKAA